MFVHGSRKNVRIITLFMFMTSRFCLLSTNVGTVTSCRKNSSLDPLVLQNNHTVNVTAKRR